MKVKHQHRLRKDERLEVRVTPDQKRLVERAAELRGSRVTEFGVADAQQAAAETTRDFETLALRDQAAITRNPQSTASKRCGARTAAQRYKTQMWRDRHQISRTGLGERLLMDALHAAWN